MAKMTYSAASNRSLLKIGPGFRHPLNTRSVVSLTNFCTYLYPFSTHSCHIKYHFLESKK